MIENVKKYFNIILDTEDEKKVTLLAVLCIFAVVTLFHIFYYNKFLPPTDGWFYTMAQQIKNGMMPYRDFSYCMTPFYLYKISIINSIFGDAVINMRIYGIIERCIICSLLFLSLKCITPIKYAFLVSIVSFMCMTTVGYDLISSSVQCSILCSTIVLYLWTKTIKATKTWEYYLYLFLIGLFCFQAFQYKQTTGFMISFASFVLVFLTINDKFKPLWTKLLSFLSGLLIPLTIFFTYLHRENALVPYFKQLFLEAAGEKGGILNILLGLITHNFPGKFILVSLIIVALVVYISMIKKEMKDFLVYPAENSKVKHILLLAILSMTAILLAYSLSMQTVIRISIFNTIRTLMPYIASFCFIASLLIGVRMLCEIYKKDNRTSYNQYLLIFAGIAFGLIIASGVSLFFDVNTIIITISLLFVIIFNYRIPKKQYKDFIICLAGIVLVFCIAHAKYNLTYEWWGWFSSPIRYGTIQPEVPRLKGFSLPAEEANLAEDIYNLSQELLINDDDYIYCFPNIPLGHVLSGKVPKNVSSFPHIDVYSDEKAIKEADFILKNPPKIIFYSPQSDTYWDVHEKFFRAGEKSGQRNIDENIKKLIKNKELDYKLLKRYEDKGLDYNSLYIYYRGALDEKN